MYEILIRYYMKASRLMRKMKKVNLIWQQKRQKDMIKMIWKNRGTVPNIFVPVPIVPRLWVSVPGLDVRPGTRIFLSFSGTYEMVDSSHYTTPAEISRVTSAKKREELNEVKNLNYLSIFITNYSVWIKSNKHRK